MDIELKDFLVVMMMMISWQLRRNHYYLNEKMKSYQPIHWPNNNGCRAGQATIFENPGKKNIPGAVVA